MSLSGKNNCRLTIRVAPDQRSRDVIEAAERYADGALSDVALTTAWLIASHVESRDAEKKPPARSVASAALCTALPDACTAARECLLTVSCVDPALRLENGWHASALRDIFGIHFQPIAASADWQLWNKGLIPALAQSVNDHRVLPDGTLDPSRLAVLANALEMAGCSDEAALGHLRGPGPHFRGCYVLDALLGLV